MAYALLRDQLVATATAAGEDPDRVVDDFDADLARPVFAAEAAAERRLVADLRGLR